MREVEFDRGRVLKYLAWAFGLAYAIQAVAAFVVYGGHLVAGRLVVAGMMFVPMLAVLLAGGSLRGMGWDPRLKRNWKSLLIAWLAPLILTAAGAALYFLAFPGHFDLSGGALAAAGGEEALAQLQAQGVSYPLYVLVAAVSSVTYAPLMNTVVALGEELGWRGFLYPQLKARFGRKTGWLLGGVIWGAWHWPLIWLTGYEYGADYIGFPIVGMLLFCAVTVAWGVLHDWLYERSGSIWVPALFHGAINAAATVPAAVCLVETGSARLLGPAPNGLLAGSPLLIAAAVVLFRKR